MSGGLRLGPVPGAGARGRCPGPVPGIRSGGWFRPKWRITTGADAIVRRPDRGSWTTAGALWGGFTTAGCPRWAGHGRPTEDPGRRLLGITGSADDRLRRAASMGHRCGYGARPYHNDGPSMLREQHGWAMDAVPPGCRTATMAHGWVSAGVRRVPDGLARAPGALRGRFNGTKVPPVPNAGIADCPGCQKCREWRGRLRAAGPSDFRTRVSRTSESRQAGQPPFAARHRPAPRRDEPGINPKPARRRRLQDPQACFRGNLRWHSIRGFHNHPGACRRTPAAGAFRPAPAKPETQTDPPPAEAGKGWRTSPARATPRS